MQSPMGHMPKGQGNMLFNQARPAKKARKSRSPLGAAAVDDSVSLLIDLLAIRNQDSDNPEPCSVQDAPT